MNISIFKVPHGGHLGYMQWKWQHQGESVRHTTVSLASLHCWEEKKKVKTLKHLLQCFQVQGLTPFPMLAATLASLRINNLHVFCAHSEHSTVIMLSDCWLKWHVSCVWYYLYMAILHAHVPSFVSASRCMALLSVMCLALSQHHTALLLIDTA